MRVSLSRPVMVLVAALVLSCGGGGTNGDGIAGGPPTGSTGGSSGGSTGGGVPGPGSAITADIAADVPTATTSKIALVVAPSGSAANASSLSLPSTSSNVLVATDSNGAPLLLALDSSDGVLSIQTTAVALVRIGAGLGVVPSGSSLAGLMQGIAASAHYGQLIAATTTSLQLGQSPISSQEVVEATWAVIDDLRSARITTGLSRPKPLAVVEVSSSPFDLVAVSPFTERVWIEDANGGAVNLMNRSLLSWHVKVTNIKGGVAEEYPGPLEALKNLYISTDLLSLYVSTPSITALVTGNEAKILFEQDDQSRLKNLLEVARQSQFALMSVLVKFAPSGTDTAAYKCVQDAFEAGVNKNAAALLAYATGDAAMKYLETLLQDGAVAMLKCEYDPDKIIKDAVKPILAAAVQEVWSKLNLAAKVTTVGMTGMQLHDFWRYSQEYHICKSGGKIVACGVFEFKTRLVSSAPSGALFTCTQRDGSILGFQLQGSYEQCQANAYVEVSCVGACAGRFFFNRDDVTQVTTITRYFTGNPVSVCGNEGTTISHPFGPQSYTPGSDRWLPADTPFIAAAFLPNNNSSFVRNVSVSLNPDYSNNQQLSVCAASAQSYGVAIRIYDTVNFEYIEIPTILSVP